MAEQRTRSTLDRFFKISERGSTPGREIRGGIVTFFTMAYIVVLNPLIIGSFSAEDAGAHKDVLGNILPVPQVAAVTALVAGVLTIVMGLVANYPFAIATGLGINSLIAVTFASQMTWPEAMGLVVIEGLVIVLLVFAGIRTAVFNAVPPPLKSAIAVGIGLFICLIGLVDAGFVRRVPDEAKTTVPVGLGINGSIASWPTLVFVVGLLVTGILVAKRIKGAILIGVLASTVVAIVVEAITKVGPSKGVNPQGWNLGYPALPEQVLGVPDLSLVGDISFGAWTRLPIITVVLLVFTLVLADFFDTMGSMTGLAKEGGLLPADGKLPNVGKALFVDGTAAVAGGFASSSSNTVFVESASGIAEGARTGLANVVTGVLFIAAMFLTPLYQVVPVEAAAPALVVVGALMMSQVKEIDFSDFTIALPAFLTIVIMPFTYSIANGIGAGFVSYVVIRAVTGKAKGVHPLMWGIAAMFVAYFAVGPIQAAFN
ncbi:NCS2 family permease [Amycolatopsis keratiniphila]|uniref:MFS transporter n=1 Tax=Amycolatopsis keratiniphila subsp. keratiniphila TaxID=227715 RepID=A0A1W2LVH0_9PSEU|nr:NCS2 family permease [Amycolatopsis keratiniphila]OLZ52043.1 MFS transporter [Amycolatopsis keratiniphila subsp. nogabecina]ONF69673.1 MFS transporter [Amycolatopsis keratiniphila subsp. keratiniphila]SDU61232.1 putative MFS transporter, AGZA family, xanthine/uracil permease [Amycolatopsis keratiniphila]